MESPDSDAKLVNALWEISASLFALRDALVELSLSLKDWQFEADQDMREDARTQTRELMSQMGSGHPP